VIVKYLLKVALLGSSWVMYLLLLLSVFSIAAMIERAWFFRKYGQGGQEMGDALIDLLEHGDRAAAEGLLRRHSSIEADVLRASLRWASGGPEALASGIDGELTKRRKELERWMTLLGTLGNNAPFVGLLGTVIGVIVAFADLAGGSNKVQMDKVMGGIAEALVATGVGLFVAIPAVVAYNIFTKKITDVEDNVASISARLCALLAVVGTFDPERDAPQEIAAVANPPPGEGLGRLAATSAAAGDGAVPAPPVDPPAPAAEN
jgi:biopolymer transport protein ExbB/biopolymer transport protein TolQ